MIIADPRFKYHSPLCITYLRLEIKDRYLYNHNNCVGHFLFITKIYQAVYVDKISERFHQKLVIRY